MKRLIESKVYRPNFGKPLPITGMDLCPCCGRPHEWMPREWQKRIAKRAIVLIVGALIVGVAIGRIG